ncbi:hypothetical protein BDN72DRAFT_906173 [Pluteus cervinus]|uniref:Uncharacterized protein n=1 Tax=Pluteus cervinus TaxID=181527 RepID=A0ACD3A099_9AGAR|nr:hypothetical protein BDN72DRAFT_906173 [Pluteus cervinus]
MSYHHLSRHHRQPQADMNPPDWTKLKFNPVGLQEIEQLFQINRNTLARHPHRFLASNIAWFCGGACSDGTHLTVPDTFHQLFSQVREGLPSKRDASDSTRERNEVWKEMEKKVKQSVFDHVTTWDRAFGGSTIVIHVEGTTRPGSPVVPEHLRAYTYLPPIVKQLSETHQPVIDLVQSFIRHIGIPTAHHFKAAARKLHWSLDGRAEQTPNPYPATITFPSPVSSSSLEHVFYGVPIHDVGNLSHAFSSTTLSETVETESQITDTDALEEELRQLEEQNDELMAVVHTLQDENNLLKTQVRSLMARTARDLTTSSPSRPSPFVRSTPKPAYPTVTQPQPALPSNRFQPSSPHSVLASTRSPQPTTPSRVAASRLTVDTPSIDNLFLEPGSVLNTQFRERIIYLVTTTPPLSWLTELQKYGLGTEMVLKLLAAMNEDAKSF